MRIIVGVDESPGSAAALEHALREAAAHSAEVVVVHAWEPPFEAAHPYPGAGDVRAAAQDDARQRVEGMVTRARRHVGRPVRRLVTRPVQGEAAQVLTGMAREHDLIVVGSNRAGPLRRLLLGSVFTRVVRESDVPVMVVPAPKRRRHGDDACRWNARPGRSALSAARTELPAEGR